MRENARKGEGRTSCICDTSMALVVSSSDTRLRLHSSRTICCSITPTVGDDKLLSSKSFAVAVIAKSACLNCIACDKNDLLGDPEN